MDYSALVSGSAVALRNLPTGKHVCVALCVQGWQGEGSKRDTHSLPLRVWDWFKNGLLHVVDTTHVKDVMTTWMLMPPLLLLTGSCIFRLTASNLFALRALEYLFHCALTPAPSVSADCTTAYVAPAPSYRQLHLPPDCLRPGQLPQPPAVAADRVQGSSGQGVLLGHRQCDHWCGRGNGARMCGVGWQVRGGEGGGTRETRVWRMVQVVALAGGEVGNWRRMYSTPRTCSLFWTGMPLPI